MKKIIISIMMAFASLVSCQKSNNITLDESSKVVFTSSILTKATGTLWEDGDEIGAFMIEPDDNTLYDNSSNVLYTTSGGSTATFTSLNPLLFPSDKDVVDYIAYYPYTKDVSNNVITLNTADQRSEEGLKSQDFMVASAQKCSSSQSPSLSFKRKMSKILINVTRNETMSDAVLSEISLSGVISDGTYAISNIDRENGSVAAGTTSSNISMFFNEEKSIIEAIIIPQTISSSKLTIYVDNEIFVATISNTFEGDTQYNYNLTIGPGRVDFTTGSITNWEEDDKGVIESTKRDLSYIQFKRNEVSTANMTKVDDAGAINNLLSKFRRCLMTSDGNGNATICYLNNSNSNKYYDNTDAQLNGSEGDIMVYFPEYWYKYENVDEEYFRYYFSESAKEGYIHVNGSLVGAYKAYCNNGKVYSRSNVAPTRSVSYYNFKEYSYARGKGYQIIDYDQHSTIAIMLYIKYLNRNIKAILGLGGADPNTITGSTNSIGNIDTSNETNGWVNGLGLEGAFGGVSEWTYGVVSANYSGDGSISLGISIPSWGSKRWFIIPWKSGYVTAMAFEGNNSIKDNDGFLNMLPTQVNPVGVNNSYYADYYEEPTYGSTYMIRSCCGENSGVTSLNFTNESSSNIGSRLAFRGTITEAESVAAYKALLVD